MTAFFLSRLKAFAALFAAGAVVAGMKAFEGATGFDIPTEAEVAIAGVVSGWFVHDVPNVH